MNEVKNEVKAAEAEEKKIIALTATEKENNEVEDAEDDDLILTFNKPYVFEGKTYTKIDLPYYFGAVSMDFAIPRIRREDNKFV